MVESAPQEQKTGDCDRTGVDALTLTLVARRGSEEHHQDVEMVQLRRGVSAESVAFSTTALDGDFIVAEGEKNAALWGDELEVESVASCHHRTLDVRHSEHQAVLAADGSWSDAFSGTTLGGNWSLRSALNAEELRVPAKRPKSLALLARFRCKETFP